MCSLSGSFGRTYLSENNGWIEAELHSKNSSCLCAGKDQRIQQVEVLTENNRTVLALYEPENTGYVTYIYLYKRKLRELFTKKERGIEWESGQELVSADTFSVIKQKEDLLRIHLSGSGQKARNLYQAQQEASSMAEILEGGTDSLYHRYVYW